MQALVGSAPIIGVERRVNLARVERDDEVEDDSREVGRGDRVEEVDCPWSGVKSVSETYSDFLEFGARA